MKDGAETTQKALEESFEAAPHLQHRDVAQVDRRHARRVPTS